MIAGTIDAMSKRITVASRLPDEFPPASSLVIATLDGSTTAKLDQRGPGRRSCQPFRQPRRHDRAVD